MRTAETIRNMLQDRGRTSTAIGQSLGNKETREPCAMKVARTVRRGTGRKGSNDLARGLPYLVCSQTLLIARVIDEEPELPVEPAPIGFAVSEEVLHGWSPLSGHGWLKDCAVARGLHKQSEENCPYKGQSSQRMMVVFHTFLISSNFSSLTLRAFHARMISLNSSSLTSSEISPVSLSIFVVIPMVLTFPGCKKNGLLLRFFFWGSVLQV